VKLEAPRWTVPPGGEADPSTPLVFWSGRALGHRLV